eukprot:GHVH01011516.1.p1 GENE.GHVH01011516.1~~GHVH01011516.1.p1  ORF type:complete len:674 (-),score=79.81 GHVH01011516.1:1029-3050(-)
MSDYENSPSRDHPDDNAHMRDLMDTIRQQSRELPGWNHLGHEQSGLRSDSYAMSLHDFIQPGGHSGVYPLFRESIVGGSQAAEVILSQLQNSRRRVNASGYSPRNANEGMDSSVLERAPDGEGALLRYDRPSIEETSSLDLPRLGFVAVGGVSMNQSPELPTKPTVSNWSGRCRSACPDLLHNGPLDRSDVPDTLGYAVDMIVTTWTRDSHDLFDFEADDEKVHREAVSILVGPGNTSPKLLIRLRFESDRQGCDDVVFILDTSIENLDGVILNMAMGHVIFGVDVLAQVTAKPFLRGGVRYWSLEIGPPEQRFLTRIHSVTATAKELFQVVRDRVVGLGGEPHSVQLEVDMLMRLGRYPIRVLQLVAKGDVPILPSINLLEGEASAVTRSNILLPSDSKLVQCRICLSEGGKLEDPLVSACSCRGSIQYIHAGCLRYWFRKLGASKDEDEDGESNFACCNIVPSFCELCRAQFPPHLMIPTEDRIGAPTEKFELTNIQKLLPPFVVLESLPCSIGDAKIYAHSLKKLDEIDEKSEYQLLVGRGHESQMRIGDVSISRVHAKISLTEGSEKFVLKDVKSKFGSLVECKGPVILSSVPPDGVQESILRTSLQCGRSVVDCIVRPLSDDERKSAEMNLIRESNPNDRGRRSLDFRRMDISKISSDDDNTKDSSYI